MLSKEKIVIVVVVGSSTFVASVIVSVLIVIRSAKLLQDTDIIDQLPGLPKRFCFESLKSATGDFSRRIGVGGSGSVFEGHIGDKQVAVKRLDGINQGGNGILNGGSDRWKNQPHTSGESNWILC